MSEASYIQLPPNSTGSKVRTFTGSNSEHEEVFILDYMLNQPSGSISGGSVGITGSVAITGSIDNWPATQVVSGTVTANQGTDIGKSITGSIDLNIAQIPGISITGSTALTVTPVALTSSGSINISLSSTGKIIIDSGSGQQVKVYDINYSTYGGGVTYLYFGTTTSATAKQFGLLSGSGTYAQTYVTPRVGAANDALFMISDTTQSGSVSLGYVRE